jgi:phenylacetate-CoA ligase
MLREVLLGYPYIEKRKLIKRTEYASPEELADIQSTLLSSVLRHGMNRVSHYRELLGETAKTCQEPLQLLKEFPLLEKWEVRQNSKSLITGCPLRRMMVTTGGSTGQPVEFCIDRFSTRQREKAFIYDQWGRVGYRFGDSIFNLRGRSPSKDKFFKRDIYFNIYYASSFRLNRSTVEMYIKWMNRLQPKFLHGYPSTIYQLALLMESGKLKLDFCYQGILCGSEKLFDFQRKKVESVFGCRVYSWYGHSECLALGGECEYSNSYHFFPQYGYTEFIPTGLKREDGKDICEIVATGFNNRVMPLIRYKTGDYAVLSDSQECACGRNYPLVDEIVGREQEFVIDEEGSVISATSLIFGQHYEAFSGLEALQIHQSKPGDIEIVLVKSERYEPRLVSLMKQKMESLLGGKMKVEISFSDEIAKSPVGKSRLVKQELDVEQYLQ